MEECTFTPNTAKSNASNWTATTRDSSGGGNESVFERLYRRGGGSVSSNSGHQKLTPIASNKRLGNSPQSISPGEQSMWSWSRTSGRSTTTGSNRLEQLYEKGVRKLRGRPVNEEAEKRERNQRAEEKELRQCTFRPTSTDHHHHRRSGDAIPRKSNHLIMEPKRVAAATGVAACRSKPKSGLPSHKPSAGRAERRLPYGGQGFSNKENKEPAFPAEIVLTHVDSSTKFEQQSWNTPPRQTRCGVSERREEGRNREAGTGGGDDEERQQVQDVLQQQEEQWLLLSPLRDDDFGCVVDDVETSSDSLLFDNGEEKAGGGGGGGCGDDVVRKKSDWTTTGNDTEFGIIMMLPSESSTSIGIAMMTLHPSESSTSVGIDTTASVILGGGNSDRATSDNVSDEDDDDDESRFMMTIATEYGSI